MVKDNITVKGKTYESLSQLCKENNIKYNTLYRALTRHKCAINGPNIEKYLDGTITSKAINCKKITIFGKTYNSYKEFNKQENKNIYLAIRTLERNCLPITDKNLKRYFDGEFMVGGGGRSQKITINGIKYRSLSEFCRKNQIPKITLLKGIQNKKIEKTSKSIQNWFNNQYTRRKQNKNIIDK